MLSPADIMSLKRVVAALTEVKPTPRVIDIRLTAHLAGRR